MRVFVTGASGYIGHSVAKAFRAKGHSVFGLVRSHQKASQLSLEEIWPVIGELENPETYRAILEDVEVVVHCAHDYSPHGVENDAKSIDTFLSVFSKSLSPRALIYTSGVWVYGSRGNQVVDESLPVQPLEIVKWRPGHEEKVLNATSQLLRTVVMRPGVVYGGTGGLMTTLFSSAQNGAVEIVGEGHNRWPMVHVQDLAYAYVSAAEKELTRVILNVVDDSTATVREMAEAIAQAAKIDDKVNVLHREESMKKHGPVIEGLQINLKVNNSRIKRLLGWQIHHAPFLYEAELYYHTWQSNQKVQEF